ncbi:hypothetical protein D9613_008293 [Agrocybe pediades]|uniref:Uncharacterized protein n=1 Tax=Agrocybe pediades TaxID=84607 RepID=A0A8H4VNZ4_9AGAR|nr:hypothetical protein D9613_008293 [Agrocybe pediades]
MSSGTKRRRANTNGASNTDEPSLARLNQLMAEAVKIAKAIEPTRGDGPAIKKAHTLAKSLLKALPTDVVVKSVGYDEHKASFEAEMKALQTSCKKNWKYGYEDQEEMMKKLSKSVVNWLKELWSLMQEEDMDLKLIEKSLALCSDTIDKMMNCNSRAGYLDMTFKAKIVNDEEETIFEENVAVTHTLGWMWRELLVIASTRGTAVKTMLTNIKLYKLIKEVFNLFRDSDSVEKNCDGYGFWDDHWSDEMKDAAVKVRSERPDEGKS